MNIAFHTGVSGLMAYQEGLNLIAHNVSNVNTEGFKPSQASFRDLVKTNMDIRGEEKFLYGHGVRSMGGNLTMNPGNMRTTDNPLDFAITGDAFFAVQTPTRGIQYTKNGSFTVSVEEDGNYLIQYDGSYVLDSEGERISVSIEEDGGNDTEEGGIPKIDYAALQEKIGLFSFANPYGLGQTDGTKFIANDISGEAVVLQEDQRSGLLRSNTLEASGVNMSDEMVAMMQTQKAFQFSAKVVQTADQVEEIVNNLR